jgi:hypothetical protein
MMSSDATAALKLSCIPERLREAVRQRPWLVKIGLFIYVWLSLVKVPATAVHDSPPQSWQAVLAYAAAHHLQWGRDIVFTYGPLGFLSSEFYWGYFLWPMVISSFALGAILSIYLVKLMPRLPALFKAALLIGLPLLTVPSALNLSVDPIVYSAVVLGGILCLPSEKPRTSLLILTGALFGFLSLIKFTFFVYCGFTLIIVLGDHLLVRRFREIVYAAMAYVTILIGSCAVLHQQPSSVLQYLKRSVEVAGGYSKGMMLGADTQDLLFGVPLLILLAATFAIYMFRSRNWHLGLDRAAVICAGIFLAWKEGFVRADEHVTVFFVFSFIIAALLPALLPASNPANEDPPNHSVCLARRFCFTIPSRTLVLLNALVMVVAVAPFLNHRKDFAKAIATGTRARFSDTLTALVEPTVYQEAIVRQLNRWREQSCVQKFQQIIGNKTVDVLNYDQPIAILNGLRYTPHPVFQSYNAYTPGLQALNKDFFASSDAPEFLIWRFGTIDCRFPTLDDGTALLTILPNYRRIGEAGDYSLWQRIADVREAPTPKICHCEQIKLGEWFEVPRRPAWFQVDLVPSVLGRLRSFLSNSGEAFIEVQLQSGIKLRYRLPPACARSGFLLNPLLQSGTDLDSISTAGKVVRARIYSNHSFCFQPSIKYSLAFADESWPHQRTARIASVSVTENAN